MKLKLHLAVILVLAVLFVGACNKTSDEQSDQNSAKQNSGTQPGSGSETTPNSSTE